MRSFKAGERCLLADVVGSTSMEIQVEIDGPEVYDISCFGLDYLGKLSDDRYFIFFNQPSSPEGALSSVYRPGVGPQMFAVDLTRLPDAVRRLSFVVTIDGDGTMSSLRSGSLSIVHDGATVARFGFTGADFAAERAVMIAEIYRKEAWRFGALGQGFNGGLPALLAHFGGEESPPAAVDPLRAPEPSPVPAVPAPVLPRVSLGKVTLAKKGDTRKVSLAKAGQQAIHVNLNWNTPGRSWRHRRSSSGTAAPDLDLGCMWALKDGSKGVIQPIGNNFGNRTGSPFIYLDKDDRSGSAADGENLFVLRPDLIQRVMVFALIYAGTKDFSSVGGRLVITDQSGAETEIQLDNPDANRKFCAVCLLEEQAGELVITKEERYFQKASESDGYYRFGFTWSAGRK